MKTNNYGFRLWEDVREDHRKYSEAEKEKIALEVAENIIDLNLKNIRKMIGMTQAEIAEALESDQPEVSRIENHNDYRLSTLRRYIEALGGELEIFAHVEGKTVRLLGV